MKSKNIKTSICSFSLALVLCLSISGACKKAGTGGKEDVVLLSSIPEVPEYSSLPLIGPEWKLVGFAEAKHNTIKLAEPLVKGVYLFTFKEDGTISGSTSSNETGGKFTLMDSGSISIQFGLETYVGEAIDGLRYIEAMNEVATYQISSRGLSLYYKKNMYLLFHPVGQ